MTDTDIADILEQVRTGPRGSPFDPRSLVFTAASDLRKVDVDGLTVIVKHLHPDGDWLSRATGGVGRAQLLWRSGVLQQLDTVVEHGVLRVVDFGDHDAIVMRDLSGSLLSPSVMMTRDDIVTILERMPPTTRRPR